MILNNFAYLKKLFYFIFRIILTHFLLKMELFVPKALANFFFTSIKFEKQTSYFHFVIYFTKNMNQLVYHKSFPTKHFPLFNSYSLSRYRVLNILIPKNGHFTVYYPKISLKWSKINIFFSFFFLKLSKLHKN